MDRNGQLYEGLTAPHILSMIGGTITDYDGLPDDCFGKIEMGGKQYDWGVWGDQIEAGKGG